MYERTKVQQELLTRLETHLQWFPIHMLFQRNQVTAYSVRFGLFIQENILRDNSNPDFFFFTSLIICLTVTCLLRAILRLVLPAC